MKKLNHTSPNRTTFTGITIVLAIGALLIAISGTAHADGKMPPHDKQAAILNHAHRMHRQDLPPPCGPENAIPHFLQTIELTEAQEDKIFQLMHAQAPAMREQHKILHKAREELYTLSNSNAFSDSIKEKSRKLATTIGSTLAEIELMRAETDARIRSLLDDKQRKQLDENRKEFHELPAPQDAFAP